MIVLVLLVPPQLRDEVPKCVTPLICVPLGRKAQHQLIHLIFVFVLNDDRSSSVIVLGHPNLGNLHEAHGALRDSILLPGPLILPIRKLATLPRRHLGVGIPLTSSLGFTSTDGNVAVLHFLEETLAAPGILLHWPFKTLGSSLQFTNLSAHLLFLILTSSKGVTDRVAVFGEAATDRAAIQALWQQILNEASLFVGRVGSIRHRVVRAEGRRSSFGKPYNSLWSMAMLLRTGPLAAQPACYSKHVNWYRRVASPQNEPTFSQEVKVTRGRYPD